MEQYENFILENKLRELFGLPTLSIEEIEAKIREELKIVFKILYNHVDIVKIDLDDLMHLKNFKTTTRDANFLLLTANLGDVKKFDDLLTIGFDRNYTDKYGANALLYASDGGNISMVNHLITMGFDRNFTDNKGNNALLYTITRNRYGMFEYLITLGFDKNFSNNSGWNALNFAILLKDVRTTMFLLKHKLDVKNIGTITAFDATFLEAESRIRKARVNVFAFQVLIRLMMGFIRHRYWSPNGKGYHHAHQLFIECVNYYI